MIVHRYADDSEDYEYELGDVVEITGTIQGGWFNCAVGKTGPVVELDRARQGTRKWRIDPLYVKESPDWGPSHCMPWQIKPTPETRESATEVSAA